jgi:integrase
VSWKPAHVAPKVPNSLQRHRRALSVKTADSDRIRRQIARTSFADVTTDLLQKFVNKLVEEGSAASTVNQEIAILRQLFKHARKRWKWFQPAVNPASDVDLPALDNDRERVMSAAEQERIVEALGRRRAKHVVELVGLAVESAMRAAELVSLTWAEVRVADSLIVLHDGKTGARSVPLSPLAIAILEALRPETERTGRVFPGMTYCKLAKAWRRSCEEAGVSGLHFHDVRGTAATRFALGAAGRNVFLVRAITGHKTLKSVERYVRVAGEDCLRKLPVSEYVVGVRTRSLNGCRLGIEFKQISTTRLVQVALGCSPNVGGRRRVCQRWQWRKRCRSAPKQVDSHGGRCSITKNRDRWTDVAAVYRL